jgi:hypothetical protein
MRDGDDVTAAQQSAARQVASTRRLIDESKRTIRAIREHCEAMQRHIERSRALVRGQLQPALVSLLHAPLMAHTGSPRSGSGQ